MFSAGFALRNRHRPKRCDNRKEGSYQVIIAMKDDTTFDGCKSADEVLAVLKDLK